MTSSATTPEPRLVDHAWQSLAEWRVRHEQHWQALDAGTATTVILGDSIAAGWADHPDLQRAAFGEGVVNCAIGGDATQNVLWRLDDLPIARVAPRRVVLHVGTNNVGLFQHDAAETLAGVRAVVARVRALVPEAGIQLLALLPRDDLGSRNRALVAAIEQGMADLAALGVRVARAWAHFLRPDGSLDLALLPDGLHPGRAGYERWSSAIRPAARAACG